MYHPNYEVWDRRLFELYCPGQGAIRRPRRVAQAHPRLRGGLRRAQRDPQLRGRRGDGGAVGFTTVDEAIASTTEGLRFFMSHGITPRFTTWCPRPHDPARQGQPQGAPLEYHIRLLEAYRSTMEDFGLSSPPGTATPDRPRGLLGELLHGQSPGAGTGGGGSGRTEDSVEPLKSQTAIETYRPPFRITFHTGGREAARARTYGARNRLPR